MGQPERAKEKAWDSLLRKTKRRGEGRGEHKLVSSLAKVNPSSWRLLIHIHSTHRPNLRTSSLGEGASLQPWRSSGLRREGLLPRKGVTWAGKLVGLQR